MNWEISKLSPIYTKGKKNKRYINEYSVICRHHCGVTTPDKNTVHQKWQIRDPTFLILLLGRCSDFWISTQIRKLQSKNFLFYEILIVKGTSTFKNTELNACSAKCTYAVCKDVDLSPSLPMSSHNAAVTRGHGEAPALCTHVSPPALLHPCTQHPTQLPAWAAGGSPAPCRQLALQVLPSRSALAGCGDLALNLFPWLLSQ